MANEDYQSDAAVICSVVPGYHRCMDVEIRLRSEASVYMVGLTPQVTNDQLVRHILIICISMCTC